MQFFSYLCFLFFCRLKLCYVSNFIWHCTEKSYWLGVFSFWKLHVQCVSKIYFGPGPTSLIPLDRITFFRFFLSKNKNCYIMCPYLELAWKNAPKHNIGDLKFICNAILCHFSSKNQLFFIKILTNSPLSKHLHAPGAFITDNTSFLLSLLHTKLTKCW